MNRFFVISFGLDATASAVATATDVTADDASDVMGEEHSKIRVCSRCTG